MTRLLCLLGIHRTPPGVRRALSWRFECARCHGLVAGDLGRAL